MKIEVTEKEIEAIMFALDTLEGNIACSDEEYTKEATPRIYALRRLVKKYETKACK